nr:MAG TPA: hypothetical protein [Caudoviricetes sp.]
MRVNGLCKFYSRIEIFPEPIGYGARPAGRVSVLL